MIKTEIFSHQSPNNYTCFDEVLKMVNELIKKEGIKKEDIIEYRTSNWTSEVYTSESDSAEYWNYKVIISWFKMS